MNAKNESAEDKIHFLLSQTLNPFESDYNFSVNQIANTTGPDMDNMKVAHAADPRIPASLQHLFYKGSELLDDAKPVVEKIIED